MKFRKITSLTAMLSFILLLLTSVILYIVPHGRVAYWSDWRLWSLTKTQWANLHINGGLLFLIAMFLHIYLNYKPIINYMKNSSKKLIVLTAEFNIALALLVAFCLGTYFQLPPFSFVQNIGESVKNSAIEKYGEPPYGHAELSSLKIFCQKTDLDLTAAMDQLTNAGITFDNEMQSLQDIAANNNIKPKQLYQKMLPDQQAGTTQTLPKNPKPGLGKLTLNDLCAQYSIDVTNLLKALEKEEIKATPQMTIIQIAENKQISPIDLYTIISNHVNN